jgi:hypothetical protein
MDDRWSQWLSGHDQAPAEPSASAGGSVPPPRLVATPWQDDEEPSTRSSLRPLFRLAAALGAVAVVVAVGATAGLVPNARLPLREAPEPQAAPDVPAPEATPGVPGPEAGQDAPGPDVASDVLAPGADVGPDVGSGVGPGVGPDASGDALEVADAELLAAAMLQVRSALSDAPWGERAPDGRRQYVETAVVDGARSHGRVTTVSVTAVVLTAHDDTWAGARTVRYGVGLERTPDGITVLGAPWPLPARSTVVSEPAWAPQEDPALSESVGRLLAEAGWTELEGIEVATPPEGPMEGLLGVRVRGRAPGAEAADDHRLWLEAGPALLDPAEPAAVSNPPRAPDDVAPASR